VEVDGVDRLASTLDRAARELGDMQRPGRAVAATISASARRRAPRRTGALAGSIDDDAGPLAAEVWAGEPYAKFVEYGPPYPQPFLGPALDEAQPDAEREYADELAKIVGRVEGA
jgi:HK97 gp10 family phage protein